MRLLIFCFFMKACLFANAYVTVLVSSCDKYAQLWPGFFKLLDRHVSNKRNLPIYFISNTKSPNHGGVKVIHIKNEQSWSDNIITALEQIKTPYVLFLLEDYYLTHFDYGRINQIINAMDAHNIVYAQIAQPDRDLNKGEPFKPISGAFYKNPDEPFRASLQACIFRTEVFIKLLKSGESPWDFEKKGSERNRAYPSGFITILHNPPVKYLNMVHIGHLDAASVDAAKKLGITIDEGPLTLSSHHPFKFWWHDYARPKLGRIARWLGLIK